MATKEIVPRTAGSRFQMLARLADPATPLGADVGPITVEMFEPLLALAETHGVAPLVLRHLEMRREAEALAACTPFRSRLAEADERARLLRKHASIIVARLRSRRLPAVPVGASVFARRLYPAPSLRPFDDLHLLLPRGVINAVEHELSDLGFGIAAYQKGWERLERHWVHASEPAVSVRLLGDLVSWPRLRRRVSLDYATLAGDEGPTAAERPARLLAVAAIAAAVDGPFARLSQLVDVVQAARGIRSALEEFAIDRLADDSGGRIAIVASLDLAARLFGDEQTASLAAALGPVRQAPLARRILDIGAVAEAPSGDRPAPGWRRAAFWLLLSRAGPLRVVSPSPSQNAIARKKMV